MDISVAYALNSLFDFKSKEKCTSDRQLKVCHGKKLVSPRACAHNLLKMLLTRPYAGSIKNIREFESDKGWAFWKATNGYHGEQE